MTYAYVRVSTGKQTGAGQEWELRNWAEKAGVEIDRWVRETASGAKEVKERKLGKALRRMKRGDTLVCTEISRLGRSVFMVMEILGTCSRKGVTVLTVKDNFRLDDSIGSKVVAFAFSLVGEIERKLVSQRTKEALSERRAAGVALGRPKGRSAKGRCVEAEMGTILERLERGDTKTGIAKEYGIHRNTLNRFLRERVK